MFTQCGKTRDDEGETKEGGKPKETLTPLPAMIVR